MRNCVLMRQRLQKHSGVHCHRRGLNAALRGSLRHDGLIQSATTLVARLALSANYFPIAFRQVRAMLFIFLTCLQRLGRRMSRKSPLALEHGRNLPKACTLDKLTEPGNLTEFRPSGNVVCSTF